MHATADLEHQAALELLALVMLSDAEIGDEEVEVVREISTEWREDAFNFEDYLRPAIEKARRAIETVYRIEIVRTGGATPSVTVDGEMRPGTGVPLVDDGIAHVVRVVI